MTITVGWATDQVIRVNKVDMTLVQSTPVEIYQLDTENFFTALKDLESSQEGMPWPDLQRSKTPTTLEGLTYARILEIIDPYTITFEDDQYVVQLVGTNSNIISKTNPNQVSVTGNNSAGLIQVSEIQYGAFQGAVWVDETGTSSGTLYPTGTPIEPVNNFTDALLIAQFRGFDTFRVVGDATITGGLDFTDAIFIGDSKLKTSISVDASANTTNCEFEECLVTGTLDGNAKITNGRIQSLDYLSGDVTNCILESGTITLGGGANANFLDCWSGVPGTGTPVIDMGGSGQSLAMRNYNGGVTLTNKTGPEAVSIDLNSGQVVIDDTVTAGTIVLRGTGKWTNAESYAGTANVIDELLDSQDVNQALVELDTLKKYLTNKMITDPVTGRITIYEDDGITELVAGDLFEDAAGTQPYRGQGAERRERLTGPATGVTFTIIGSDGSTYTVSGSVLNSAGASFNVSGTARNSSGGSFTVND